MRAELDPSLVESVKGKRDEGFPSVRRGYDPAQVDAFLLAIVARIEALRDELNDHLAAASDPGTEAVPARVARMVEAGERAIEQIVADAKAEAAAIAFEARSEADRTTRDAQADAKRSLEDAGVFLDQVEEDARTLVANADARRGEMVDEVRGMQERLLRVTRALELVLDPERSRTP